MSECHTCGERQIIIDNVYTVVFACGGTVGIYIDTDGREITNLVVPCHKVNTEFFKRWVYPVNPTNLNDYMKMAFMINDAFDSVSP